MSESLLGIAIGSLTFAFGYAGGWLRRSDSHTHRWGEWHRIQEHYPSGNSKTRQIRRCRDCGLERVRDL